MRVPSWEGSIASIVYTVAAEQVLHEKIEYFGNSSRSGANHGICMGYTLRTTRETVRTKQPKTKGLDYTVIHTIEYTRRKRVKELSKIELAGRRACFHPAAVRRRIHYSTARLSLCVRRDYIRLVISTDGARVCFPPLYSTRVLALYSLLWTKIFDSLIAWVY